MMVVVMLTLHKTMGHKMCPSDPHWGLVGSWALFLVHVPLGWLLRGADPGLWEGSPYLETAS